MDKPFVITIVGAESSGKTTLAMKLAEYYTCPWVPEYAREYLEGLGRPYNERDLEIISEGQLEKINKQLAIGNQQLATSNRQKEDEKQSLLVTLYSSLVIVDGGMMNLRLWAKIKYKSTIQIIEDALKDDMTDLYLLCRPLNEWEPDPMREAPSIIDRVWIYNQYLEELSRSKGNLEIINGMENEKFNKAVLVIENLFKTIISPTK